MRALVTGGAGFIGSHLVDKLLYEGWIVTVLDDLSTGHLYNLDCKHPNLSIKLDSVLNKKLTNSLMEEADVVFHLAATVGVELVLKDPLRTIQTNIKTTEIILDSCLRNKKPVLLTSTSEVYGHSQDLIFKEDGYLTLGATNNSRWCYAASKIIDEFLAQSYDIPTIIVRLFNTIGPRQSGQYGMVVPRFIKQALNGDTITVYGDGTQTRSFTWVKDVVNALFLLIKKYEAFGEIINIGHTQQISIIELAYKIKSLTNSKSEIIKIPYENIFTDGGFEDMQRRCPDLTKIENLIGYKPSLDLDQMLKKIIEGGIK